MFKEFQLETIFIYDSIWVIMQTRLQHTLWCLVKHSYSSCLHMKY